MTKKIRLITTILGLLLFNSHSLAAQLTATSAPKHLNKNNTNDELQKIINEFDSYVAGIPQKVREEIKEYRIKIVNVNKEKRELFKRISQEAQSYLAEEQKYKKRILALKKDQANSQETINTPKNNEADHKTSSNSLSTK